MDILILVAAVLLIGLFCYKNVPTLIGGIVCSVILMIIYKMNIVDGLFDTYMGGLVGFMKSWMILFFLGALFGKLLDVHVQRLSTLAGGGHVCTTHIPVGMPIIRPGARNVRRK